MRRTALFIGIFMIGMFMLSVSPAFASGTPFTPPPPAPPAYGTTSNNLPGLPNSGGGYAPNATFVPTPTSGSTPTTQPIPYYDVNANATANTNSASSGGAMGPPNPATSANVIPGFTSHATYNGN